MNTKGKNIPRVGLVIAIVLFASAAALITIAIVRNRKQNKEENPDDSPIDTSNASSGLNGGQSFTSQTSAKEQIKKMQSYLLNLGRSNNNNTIIDAIQLTGGIDGIMGPGFNLALNEAIDKGYVDSLEYLRSRVSNI